jgi:hypothetical protein
MAGYSDHFSRKAYELRVNLGKYSTEFSRREGEFGGTGIGVMAREDWLVGRDRGSEAADRIYAAASELVSREDSRH